MAIGKIKASRVNNVDATTYVGEEGILFYNFANGVIRLSDGITSGGVPVPYTIASNTVVGGIKAGPGVVISNEGQLFIDSANLAFSFGNFTANDNILNIVNSNENMILSTQGNAEIQLVGNIGFYKSNGLPPNVSNRFFFAQNDGQLTILVPAEDPIAGGFEIIGSATGTFVQPGAAGTMLHLTGNPDIPCRVYHDSLREYSSYVARRYNGNTSSPSQVLAGQDVYRINATAATDSGMGNVSLAQIRFTALEDQTTTAQGSEISFYVTPIGSPASSRIKVANFTGANGVTATKFTTSGNITAGNLTLNNGGIVSSTGLISTTANISAGNITITGIVSASGNVTGGNLITTGFIYATGNITAGNIDITGAYTGYYDHTVRDAGLIADAGTVTINFATDDIVKCIWGNGLTVSYSNFIPGRSVRLLATKLSGSGTDTLSLGSISANQTSIGSTTISGSADVTYVIEFLSIGSTVADVYAKV